MDTKLQNDIVKVGKAGGAAAGIGRGLTKNLACLMIESGIPADADKKTNEVWLAFQPAYMSGYASKYGDKGIGAAIAANDIKAAPDATDSDRVELNKARNACQAMWKAAHALAFGKVTKGADQNKADKADKASEAEQAEQGTTVSTREGAAAFLVNNDAADTEIVLWATSPEGIKAMRKWAAKAMPQPK